MKLHLISIILLNTLPAFSSYGQDPTFTLIHTIYTETKFFTTDKLQQIYVITSDNDVVKYTPDGNEQYRFSNNTLGELTYLDATDPFNLLLYYPDYQLVVTLDRTLNQTGIFSLIKAGVVQARTVGLSNDGNIWVYDEVSFQLRKFSRSGEVLFESQNLSLLLPQAPQPVQIIATEDFVYLNDPAQGILVFDVFGQYSKTIDIKGITHLQVLEGKLVYRQSNKLVIYDLKSFSSFHKILPKSTDVDTQIQIQKNHLFVKQLYSIEVYLL